MQEAFSGGEFETEPDRPPIVEPLHVEFERFKEALDAEDPDAANSAFTAIYVETESDVTALAWKFARTPADVDDIKSETYRRLYSWLGSFRGRAKISSVLHKITRNTAFNYYKKSHASAEFPTDYSAEENGDNPDLQVSVLGAVADDPAEVFVKNEAFDKLALHIEQLPLHMQHTVALRLQGFNVHEIAGILETTESNVKIRLFRARDILNRLRDGEELPSMKASWYERMLDLAKEEGFIDTYLLLPAEHRSALRWYMASGHAAAAAVEMGMPEKNVAALIDTSVRLLELGTRDYRKYAAGGESSLASPMRALSAYPVFHTILHTSDLPSDSMRYIKNFVATRPGGDTSEIGKEKSPQAVTRFMDSAVNGLGRVVIQSVKFEDRFAMQWLGAVWGRDDYKHRRAQLQPLQERVIHNILSAGNLQIFAEATSQDVVDVWKAYRTAVSAFVKICQDEAKVETGHGKDMQPGKKPRWSKKHMREVFLHPDGFELTNRYIYMSRLMFLQSYKATSAELGIASIASIQNRFRRVETQLPETIRYFSLGFKGFAFKDQPGESGRLQKALLKKDVSPGQVQEAVKSLPELQAKIFDLRYRQGMGTRKVAAELGFNPTYIKSNVTEATRMLAQKLLPKPDEYEDGPTEGSASVSED